MRNYVLLLVFWLFQIHPSFTNRKKSGLLAMERAIQNSSQTVTC